MDRTITTIEVYKPARDRVKKAIIGTDLNIRDLASKLIDNASESDIKKAIKEATKELEITNGEKKK